MADRARTGNKAVGDRIRAKREILGLTQEELAFRVGLTQHFLSQVERGISYISKGNLERLAGALDEDEAYLQRGNAGMPKDLERLTNAFVAALGEKRKQARKLRDLTELDTRELSRELADFIIARLSRITDRPEE